MIREATKEDIPILLHMGEQFFNASDFGRLTDYDRDSTRQTFVDLISNGILLVGEIEGSVIGMVGAVLYPLYFNIRHLTGQEMFWWVDPDYRKTGIGKQLLVELEKKAYSMGADSFSMIALDKINPEIMGRVYKMNGYFPAEHSYYKRLT